MKSIDDFLKEEVTSVDFAKVLTSKSKFRLNLNEAEDDDFAGDDLGGDDLGGDDLGGDDDGGDDFGGDDFGGDDFGGDLGGDGDDAGGDGDDASEDGEEDDETEGEDDHEPDPDFTDGIKNPSSTVLDAEPSGETVYDSEGVFKSIKGVIESLPKEQLAEIDGVKNCLELIFSGKKLKPEDLEFDNLQNAIFLINKIMEPLDDRTRNYAKIKLKTPLQVARDEEKLELAGKVKDLQKKRDTILNIDKLK